MEELLESLTWSDEFWSVTYANAIEMESTDRDYLTSRLVHHFFLDYCRNMDLMTVPNDLKRLLSISGNGVCNILGIGNFLAKAICLGEINWVSMMLFDKEHCWIEKLSEFDLNCLCEMLLCLCASIRISGRESQYQQGLRENKKKLCELVYGVLSSKAVYDMMQVKDRLYKSVWCDWEDEVVLMIKNEEIIVCTPDGESVYDEDWSSWLMSEDLDEYRSVTITRMNTNQKKIEYEVDENVLQWRWGAWQEKLNTSHPHPNVNNLIREFNLMKKKTGFVEMIAISASCALIELFVSEYIVSSDKQISCVMEISRQLPLELRMKMAHVLVGSSGEYVRRELLTKSVRNELHVISLKEATD